MNEKKQKKSAFKESMSAAYILTELYRMPLLFPVHNYAIIVPAKGVKNYAAYYAY